MDLILNLFFVGVPGAALALPAQGVPAGLIPERAIATPVQGVRTTPLKGTIGPSVLVETTWEDPAWVLAVSDAILKSSDCLADLPCDPASWFERIDGPACYPTFIKYWKFVDGYAGAAPAVSVGSLGDWPVDGLYVRPGVSYQLYSDELGCVPEGSVRGGGQFTTVDVWSSLVGTCGGLDPNTDVLPGAPGGLDSYSIQLCPAGICDLPFDCNANGIDDGCEIANGAAQDCDFDSIPDACQPSGIFFVDDSALPGGSGTSWDAAFRSLDTALAYASTCTDFPIVELWVKAGTYRPSVFTGSDPRAATFAVRSRVQVYGGFSGTESAFEQRDPAANLTVLSGDLNGDDAATGDRTDNAYHVLDLSNVTSGTMIDGFTIEGGQADGPLGVQKQGSGVYAPAGSPQVSRCRIRDCQAVQFGTVFFSSDGAPTVMDCVFEGNSAEFGGGVYVRDAIELVVSDCQFTGNQASSQGGGVFSTGPGLTLRIADCTFTNNAATIQGGGIKLGLGVLSVERTSFVGNSSLRGGGVRIEQAVATVSASTFEGNTAGESGGSFAAVSGSSVVMGGVTLSAATADRGGALFFEGSDLNLYGATFTGNEALNGGGGGLLTLGGGELSVSYCTFEGNTASGQGGAIECTQESLGEVRGSEFLGNSAVRGGGVYAESAAMVIEGCEFVGNAVFSQGGGVYFNSGDGGEVTHCRFTMNDAQRGGGFAVSGAPATISDCTFDLNSALQTGGGLDLRSSSPVLVRRCSLVDNESDIGGGATNAGTGPVTIEAC